MTTFVKTYDRWEACEVFINTWLRDKTLYCNNCGEDYFQELFPCCEKPQIGRNLDHTYGLIRQNREMQKEAKNPYQANKSKTMRWGVSIPPRLYHALDKYLKSVEGKETKLFRNQQDIRSFAKKFKAFRIPEKL